MKEAKLSQQVLSKIIARVTKGGETIFSQVNTLNHLPKTTPGERVNYILVNNWLALLGIQGSPCLLAEKTFLYINVLDLKLSRRIE